MCFNSLTTMQLVVYAFCGLHSLNVLLLPGYMVSIIAYTSFFKLFIWSENLMEKLPLPKMFTLGGPLSVSQIIPLEAQGGNICGYKYNTVTPEPVMTYSLA